MAAARLKTRLRRALAGLAVPTLLLATLNAAQATTPPATPTPRQLVQHLLRRFAFSDSPANVSAVLAEGTQAWLAKQLNWQAIDDSASELDKPPTAYVNPTTCSFCLPNYDAFEALIYQHNLLTNRQLQAKLELHWLDHFSIGQGQIDRPSMYNYDQVVRSHALGNFGQLVAAVGVTPAMLWWLDNDSNNELGPNVNWARELMQIYTIGQWQLNPDGSQKLDTGGHPIPNYTEADIKAMARVMSGYHSVWLGGSNPMTNYIVVFNAQEQYSGSVQFLGATRTVPHDQTAIAYVVNILAHHPSAAPFQVTELLKRFVTETPSPQFISDIVAVWVKNENAPDQIAQVVSAIINHPDFALAYHSMPKQPIEKIFQALRQLPGRMQAAPASGFTWSPYTQAGQSVEYYLSSLNQDIFWPPNVFSFYTPGNLSTMTTTSGRVGQSWVFSQLIDNTPPQAPSTGTWADTWIDLPTLQATINSANGPPIANYLLDALVDGGSPGLRKVIYDYLGERPSKAAIQGAMWLILNSPEYAVN
jgi:uncharacterized protein (DUF1800 family)